MTISKKKLKEIGRISLMDEILKENLYDDYFAASAPDTWNDSEKLLYDMMCILEYRILKKVEYILTNK